MKDHGMPTATTDCIVLRFDGRAWNAIAHPLSE
jgi:hypothetical protein